MISKKYVPKMSYLRTFLIAGLVMLGAVVQWTHAESASDYVAIPPLIDNQSSSNDKPNVLFILDNSNSMDEAPTGQAVGSANPGSKSEIARNAIKGIIDQYGVTSRMGLMAYDQSGVVSRRLHDSQYDASYNPANYDSSFNGDRDSLTKKYRVPNPADAGEYIHYNIALPFYSSSNLGTAFCYSSTADFDNGSEDPSSGPWDTYDCYSIKTGTNDNFANFQNRFGRYSFRPTDSDFAQNILDFGTHLTWQYVSQTWFSNTSPGRGYLHVEIDDVDSSHYNSLFQKLAVSQFSSSTDTPLRNAGLTPIEGTLRSARDYYNGSLAAGESFTGSTPAAPPVNNCGQRDYVILVTDGLPSVDASGNELTNTSAAISAAATEAANLLADGVRTFVVGFALPNGVDGSLLDTIAQAGGTESTYLAEDEASLDEALQSIFLSFSSREISSASAAVLSTDFQGDGALYRALYSPTKEDAIGSEVLWGGELFGVFIDSSGFVREDTNQNNQLDGYNEDRVVEYYFDAVLGRTRANLYISGDADTPPDVSVQAPVDDVEVDELATIWSARESLAEVQDVLTQREYTSEASEGRYIISSVDGENALAFVQVSDAEIQALVDAQSAAQTALTNAQAEYDVAFAQYEGAVDAVADLEDQRDDALIELQTAQTNVSTAQAALNAANLAYTNAQATLDAEIVEYEAAATDFVNNYDTREGAVTTASTALSNALTNFDSQSSQSQYDALINAVISEGGDTSDPAVVAAQNALNNQLALAASARTSIDNNVTSFNSDYSTQSSQIDNLLTLQNDNGSISGAERATLDSAIAQLDTAISNLGGAVSAYDYDALTTARQAYYTALIDTGVNANRPVIRSAREDWEDQVLVERQALNDASDAYSNQLAASYNTYQTANNNFLQQADETVAANSATAAALQNVQDAQVALTAAEAAETAAEEANDEAVAAYQGGLDLLAPVEASFRLFESNYNAALAAYNLASQTANNSNVLINYLDVPTVEEAYNTVRFVRGEEGLAGMRSRAFDITGDCQAGEDPDDPADSCDLEVWRLGDIVHSSPALVGEPNDRYDNLFVDQTYAAFRQQYRDRRQVLYVGANDGMLHAFNAGFWDADTNSFSVTNGGSATQHPLGSELWAYVPRSALPHLQWLTDPNYAHSYYVDGSPIVFDANIFPNDATHPYGWGTVLMIGMRFGGSDIEVDADADGTDDTTVSSSYILFDVTDPEQPPVLLAEISDPALGYTTSIPTVVKERVPGEDYTNPITNEWYVAFGSGPTLLDDASSDQNAGVYLFNLQSLSFESGYAPLNLGVANAFVGDLEVFDDREDFVDDTLYFGVSSGSPSTSETGRLMRARLDTGSPAASTLLNTGAPVTAKVNVSTSRQGRRWVSFGTGRLLMSPDNITTQQHSFYGVMEPVDSDGDFTWGTVNISDLKQVANIDVLDTGEIEQSGGGNVLINGNTIETFDELVTTISRETSGWKRSFDAPSGAPSERNLTAPVFFRSLQLFTSYTPANNQCFPEGTSRLYALDARSGVAPPSEVFAVDDDPESEEGDTASPYISLGQGWYSSPTIISSSDTSSAGRPIDKAGVSGSGGDFGTEDIAPPSNVLEGRQSWRQIYFD